MALSKLSGDEMRIIFSQLCSLLDPRSHATAAALEKAQARRERRNKADVERRRCARMLERSQNVEFMGWLRLQGQGISPSDEMYSRYLAERYKQREAARSAMNRRRVRQEQEASRQETVAAARLLPPHSAVTLQPLVQPLAGRPVGSAMARGPPPKPTLTWQQPQLLDRSSTASATATTATQPPRIPPSPA